MDIDVKRFDDVTRALTGLPDYTVVEALTTGEEGLVVTVQLASPEAPCPECGEYSKRVKSCRSSLVRDAPCGGRPTVLVVVKRAFRCDGLGCPRKSFTETSDQIRARSRVTQRCREVIGRAGHDRSTASVAREYRISWATAWAAITIAAVLLLGQQPKRPVRRIGIDETRFWWKQPWLTGVFNLETGDLVVLLSGRSKHTVASWLESLTIEERQAIEVAVTDPHAGYRRAIVDMLEHTVRVVDRFHIAMLSNAAVTDVRRRRIWETKDRRGRKNDPGWRARRDLCRRMAKLTENGWTRLLRAFETDNGTGIRSGELEGDLMWAWAAKEYLNEIYDTAVNRAHAHRMLLWWYWFVAEHPITELVKLASTISTWEPEFLAYFDNRCTNGLVEGKNRIIKHVKRVGFGYTNEANYTLKIRYRCCPLPSTPNPAKQRPAALNA